MPQTAELARGADSNAVMSGLSVFDLFKIGIGPSSSHTVGPMKAAAMFLEKLVNTGAGNRLCRIECALHGSLGATGKGHGSDKAVMLGLMGYAPDSVDTDAIPAMLDAVRRSGRLTTGRGLPEISFLEKRDILFFTRPIDPHPNGMRLVASDAEGRELLAATYFSIGGGFVRPAGQLTEPDPTQQARSPISFTSADELLRMLATSGEHIAQIMRRHERTWRDDATIDRDLLRIWGVMQDCVHRGCRNEGVLPGGFKVKRRAPDLFRQLTEQTRADSAGTSDPLRVLDWVNLYALAVNEENAAGGRVVTAPTNGAAGIIPAVLHYFHHFVPTASDKGIVDFLLTAGAIGFLYKMNASISGAEVGCQGEVGVACSMAAGALCHVLGGSPAQVENAAEIAMEHHLGLTCDPVGGLVQIPCIERNAIASVKAINAARMALRGDGTHTVSLDNVIKTMRETGADMRTKYKETARGGLAVNIVEC
jgi:L-serine dehydratase